MHTPSFSYSEKHELNHITQILPGFLSGLWQQGEFSAELSKAEVLVVLGIQWEFQNQMQQGQSQWRWK